MSFRAVGLLALLTIAASARADSVPSEPPRDFAATIRPLLKTYCFECHGPEEQEGGVNYDALRSDEDALRRRSLWKRAAARVASGEMPPEEATALDPKDRDQLLGWMKRAAEYLDTDPSRRDPGPAPFRRLTRTEYNNTIRDLLGIAFDSGQAVGMPEEDRGDGFDNLAASLGYSSSLMDRYFAAADKVIDAVFAADGNGQRARKQLFSALPGPDLPEREAAKTVLIRLVRRAYRRPPRDDEVNRLLAFHDRALAKGESFEGAVRAALKPILVSPHFLNRIEEDRPASGKASGVAVGDHELAVRLSYFLWSTMPDEALDRLADSGTLGDPAVLAEQARRMLADPKARALTENFAAQWLQLKKLNFARPSSEFFPTFTGNLKRAMRDEITTFFDALREEDRSILDLLDADATYVNEELARHYGLSGVTGPKMRKVALRPEDHRGGVLGMAGILALTSHTFRTSPTQRGKYVLDVIFGTPPPPPPPNAGVLKDDNPRGKTQAQARSLREQLAQHATQATCAACHRKIDPLGFALDNYNAIGAWRESTPEAPLDVSGVLPTGATVVGADGLKRNILDRKDDFARNLTEKLLTYALGRAVDDLDEATIRDVLAALRRDNYRFSTLVAEVVRSVPFRQRRPSVAQ